MIRLENISKSYGKQTLFSQLNLDIEPGELTAIKGRIGTGKSTLLKIMAGLETSYDGACFVFGQLASKDDKVLASYRLGHIGYIPQDYQLLESLNCFENIALPLAFLKESEVSQQTKVMRVMQELQISHLKDNYPLEISGGQRQLVAIARAMVKNPKMIIGDEPTGALDKKTEDHVLACLKRRQQKGACIVIATHSDAVAASCQKIISLE